MNLETLVAEVVDVINKINSCHIQSGAKGGQFCSGGGKVPAAPNLKAVLAKATHKPSTAAKQQIADKSEKYLSSKLRISRTDNNSPFDLKSRKVGIEVKTLVDNKNDKITMHKASLARKVKAANAEKLKTFTIVIDKRAKQTKYYYREGLGSFRVKGLKSVQSIEELRKVIK